MGICLDTDANTSQEAEDPGADWKGGGHPRSAPIRSASLAGMPMQNAGKIKFEPPKVPVIFVLGGPGSGKVTHCDTLMQEKRGVTHINMMDLLQQYAIGNDMQDFSQLSSKTVTEVLMLEMKMAPAAKAYLISGYPRSMRDVVEYSEKIQVVNGVILISWRQSILQKQIDYGAKLGHVVLSLAKMELDNFFKNVMPVADYFDQSDMLVAVNGERAPAEVYKDFRAAVLDILGALENQEAILNGVTGMGRGANDIPGSIVSVETAPSQHKNNNITESTDANELPTANVQNDPTALMGQNIRNNFNYVPATTTTATTNLNASELPPIIWVIGGPGSNKATLCLKAVGLNPGWGHFSIGRLLRNMADTAPRVNTENYAIKEALSSGEMIHENTINNLIASNLNQLKDRRGIIIDGYPRHMQQVRTFEEKYKQQPPIILLDCSKLQLGRGRIDDTVSSFRRRLELFRELTLPMLRTLDTNNRLTIVDGDTDSPSVQREFEKIIRSLIQQMTTYNNANEANPHQNYNPFNENALDNVQNGDNILQDFEDNVPGTVPTISHHVSLANGHLRNRSSAGAGPNHSSVYSAKKPANNPNQNQQNGYIPNGGFNFRDVLQEAENNPIDSYM
ncbi:adenylate kinase isoenzyme 5 isoform X1 [Hermetia illucens]|uniref:adenylate kinase isoenzyme 5 isoform X1 n=1 Tax=Hermetia illucens TaxID=343691 RepID=UPI0018CBF5D8|nr:adenylate kinase isoenzyme 5 isoform X1 [Hermetia illucens]